MRTLAVTAILLAASSAHAEPTTIVTRVCVDAADPAARETLAHVLEGEDLFVVDRDCGVTYHLAKVGDRIDLFDNVERVSSNATEVDVGVTYRALYRKLRALEAALVDAAGDAAAGDAAAGDAAAGDAPAVATDETIASSPPGTQSDAPEVPDPSPSNAEPVQDLHSIYYVRLGAGAVANFDGGFAFGLGWRKHGDKHGFDASIGAVGSAVGGRVQLMTLSGKSYVETGMSFSEVGSIDQTSGFGLEFTGGVALTDKVFAQADLSLPLYSTMEGYPAVFAMSLGLGFGGH